MPDRVCVGVILGAHGLRGAVRVKSFTERPADVAAFGPVTDDAGRCLRLRAVGEAKGVVTVKIDGCDDRTAAEALKGVRLHVDRAALPAPEEEEFYYSDLIGLAAERTDGTALGTVKGMFDFGGGDVIEIVGPEGALMLPFTRAVVPVVDLPGRRLVVDPPVEIEADEKEAGAVGAGMDEGGMDGE